MPSRVSSVVPSCSFAPGTCKALPIFANAGVRFPDGRKIFRRHKSRGCGFSVYCHERRGVRYWDPTAQLHGGIMAAAASGTGSAPGVSPVQALNHIADIMVAYCTTQAFVAGVKLGVFEQLGQAQGTA